MKIHFYGTADGIPRAQNNCACTVVEINGTLYVIDLGAPFIENLVKRGKTPYDVKSIFITHTHSDHTNSMYHFISLLGWYYNKHSVTIHLPEMDYADAMRAVYRACEKSEMPDRIKFSLYDENSVYQDENVKITFYRTKHLLWQNRPSYAMLVEAEGKRVLFSGDLSNGLKQNDLPYEVLKTPIDAFICEFAHFSAEDLAPHLKDSNIKVLYFNHIADIRYEEVDRFKKAVDFPVIVSNDGDVIEL